MISKDFVPELVAGYRLKEIRIWNKLSYVIGFEGSGDWVSITGGGTGVLWHVLVEQSLK